MILTHTSWGWRHWRGGMCRMPICVASQLSVLAMQKDLALDWLDIYPMIVYTVLYPMIVIVPSIYTVIYWIDIYIYISLIGWIYYMIYIYILFYILWHYDTRWSHTPLWSAMLDPSFSPNFLGVNPRVACVPGSPGLVKSPFFHVAG